MKSFILTRIRNNKTSLDELGINQLMQDIQDTQMAIETELEEIREIKDKSSKSNNYSANDAKDADFKMEEAQAKIGKCKALFDLIKNQMIDPNRILKQKFAIKHRSVKKMSKNLTQAPDMLAIWRKNDKHCIPRDSNKDETVFQQLAHFYGASDQTA